MRRPTARQMESARDVLLWLHEVREGDGRLRDAISLVRAELADLTEPQ